MAALKNKDIESDIFVHNKPNRPTRIHNHAAKAKRNIDTTSMWYMEMNIIMAGPKR